MRILHILDHSVPLHSGYSFRTLAILREQRRLGWDTVQLTSPKQEGCRADEEEVDGLRFFRTRPIPSPVAATPLLGELMLMRGLERRIESVARQTHPDVLHAHSPVLNAIPTLGVGRKLGIPVVYEVRAFWEDAAVDHGTAREWGARYRATRALETYALRRVSAITTICEGLRGEMVERGIAADKITVIPNAVDVGRFPSGGTADPSLAKEVGLDGSPVIGFIGSFYRYEGLEVLLRAVPDIAALKPRAQVLLAGGGPEEARLRDQAASMGLGDRVRFVGRVPHDQVNRYYGLVDVLVYPRLPARLTDLVTPLKPLEAMALGKLVVASDVGGHRELIRDGETGVLFRAGDPTALASALLRLLDAPARWPELRTKARRFIETERTWPASVGRYRKVYESARSAPRAGRAAG